MRNSAHSTMLTRYELTSHGMVVREPMADDPGITTGMPMLHAGRREANYPGLTAEEAVVLLALIDLGMAPSERVAQRSGLTDDSVLDAALERIVSLNYAVRLEEAGQVLYRPVAHPML
jgi:hypothetical protein